MEVLFAGRFAGFPREAFTFFKGLAAHNDREWFQAHKEIYERACRAPLQSLVAELAPAFGGATRISRINRDMRFARGQSPYKSYIAGGVGHYYLSLSQSGLWVGTGLYKPEPATLQRLRAAIDEDGSGRALASLVTSLRRKRYDVGTHDTAARPPRGYAADHPRIDLLRMKDLYVGRQLTPTSLSTRKALDRIAGSMRDVKPLSDWLQRYVS
jgi:uncharacterized protein (TIGR02453 family)